MSARTRRRIKNLEAPTQDEVIVEAPEVIFMPEWRRLRKQYGKFTVQNHSKLVSEGLTDKQAEQLISKMDNTKWLTIPKAKEIAQKYLTKKGQKK